MAANPYVISTSVLDWPELHRREPALTHHILKYCGLRVLAYQLSCQGLWKKEQRPPQMQTDYNDRHTYLLDMIQTLEIERPRGPKDKMTAWPIMGHGPGDKLTVISKNVVDRNPPVRPGHESALEYYAAQATAQGWTLDENAVCAAVHDEQRWHDVSKIRLRAIAGCARPHFDVGLDLQGTIVYLPFSFYFGHAPHETTFEEFQRRLTQELHLQYAKVDGVHEFSV